MKGGRYPVPWLRMGNRNGHASVKFDNGDSYTGTWKKGKREGQGTYLYANGDRYAQDPLFFEHDERFTEQEI